MVAVVDEDVIGVGLVPSAQFRNQHMINLELGHSQHRFLRVFLIEDRNSVLECEGSVSSRRCYIDSTLRRASIASKCELLLSDLDSRVIDSNAHGV